MHAGKTNDRAAATWWARTPAAWQAADAAVALREAGVLRDCGRLVALSRGW
jgi:hypothetical protein